MRKNGLQWPWSCKQIASYFGYILYSIIFHIVIISKIPTPHHIYGISVFIILLGTSICSHVLISCINPADPLIYSRTQSEVQQAGYYYCTICNSHIDLFSRHCVECNKCVYQYDHHCKWVNNCIGKANYNHFCVLVISTACLTAHITIESVFSLMKILSDQKYHHDGDEKTYLFFVLTSLLLSGIGFFSVSYLLLFHAYIKLQGLSTFDYILNKKSIAIKRVVPRFADTSQYKNKLDITLGENPIITFSG